MKTIIHVNQHNIKHNIKNEDNRKPVITCKTYKDNQYCDEVTISHFGFEIAKIRYCPDKPLSCGARVWIETEADITITKV